MDGFYDAGVPAAIILAVVWGLVAVLSAQYIARNLRLNRLADTQLVFMMMRIAVLGNGVTIIVVGAWPIEATQDDRNGQLFRLIAGAVEVILVFVMHIKHAKINGETLPMP